MKNKKIIGYIRISTKKQKLERQEENILKVYPEAKIIKEIFSGTTQNRPEWQKLKKKVDNSYKLVFDSVSRMSRNAIEGVEEYFELLEKGVELEFLKEPYINTDVYQEQLKLNENLQVEDKELNDTIIKGIREYLKIVAAKQIKIAFEQAEKEVLDLRERTKEGLRETKKRGTKLGRVKGKTYETKKSKEMKEKMDEGYDIVIGSRFVTEKKSWSMRMFGSRLIGTAIWLTTGAKIKDPTSGMRLFSRKMIGEFAWNLNYGPEPDTVSFLIRQGAKIAEVQVTIDDRTAGESYLKPLTAASYMVRMLLSILVIQNFRKR